MSTCQKIFCPGLDYFHHNSVSITIREKCGFFFKGRTIRREFCKPNGPYQRHILREGDPARLPAQFAGLWVGTHKVKMCGMGKLEQPRQDKNLLCRCTTSPTNHPRKDLFHLYSISPHLPQFNSQQGPPHSYLSITSWPR
jgi:hypothetical protein